jgi:hypothetical protein
MNGSPEHNVSAKCIKSYEICNGESRAVCGRCGVASPGAGISAPILRAWA